MELVMKARNKLKQTEEKEEKEKQEQCNAQT